MSRPLFFILSVFLLVSCQDKTSKSIELQQFNEIEVDEFKKKNVKISTVLHFYNSTDEVISINYAECDIYVNGKDVATFIKKQNYELPAKSILKLPITAEFKPEDAFLNLEYGTIKVKSDIVSEVLIHGYLLNTANGKEEKIPIETNQLVLFTNDGSLSLDENGKIQGK